MLTSATAAVIRRCDGVRVSRLQTAYVIWRRRRRPGDIYSLQYRGRRVFIAKWYTFKALHSASGHRVKGAEVGQQRSANVQWKQNAHEIGKSMTQQKDKLDKRERKLRTMVAANPKSQLWSSLNREAVWVELNGKGKKERALCEQANIVVQGTRSKNKYKWEMRVCMSNE